MLKRVSVLKRAIDQSSAVVWCSDSVKPQLNLWHRSLQRLLPREAFISNINSTFEASDYISHQPVRLCLCAVLDFDANFTFSSRSRALQMSEKGESWAAESNP